MNRNPIFFFQFSSIFCIRFRLEGAIWVLHNNYLWGAQKRRQCVKIMSESVLKKKENVLSLYGSPIALGVLDVLKVYLLEETCIDFESGGVFHLWECLQIILRLAFRIFQNTQRFGGGFQQISGSINSYYFWQIFKWSWLCFSIWLRNQYQSYPDGNLIYRINLMFNCCELGQIPKSAQSTLWRLVQKVQFFAFAAKGEVDAFFKSEKKLLVDTSIPIGK